MTKAIKSKHERDGSRFLALPHQVLESQAFISLSGQQIRLLLDIAVQLSPGNNGRLQASWTYLSKCRGWTSKDTLSRSLEALIEHGLVFKTRQGRLPNRTSWFAVTWQPLHHHVDMECGPQSLPRGAYSQWKPNL
ncbi:MAG: hypothetical protein EPN62_19890 [Candidimonas sp.]|nr:MAG: hypothetical protein EPN62_19890 [Candidimonas sp.]